MSVSDTTAPVRSGERVDVSNLAKFLRGKLPGAMDLIEIRQFPGGHSNLTYLVRAGSHEWVLRRPPFGSTVKSAHDMGREFRMLSRLHSVFPKAPEPLVYCEDESVIGAPFYLMKRVHGVIYRAQRPADFSLTAHRVRDACYEFIETLAALHGISYRTAGLEEMYKGPGYLERQLSGWEKRWADARTETVLDMERALPWLKERMPAQDYGAAIIHNDYKFDNLVYDAESGTQLVGVLDWEMATVGDPLSDFAVALTTWIDRKDERETSVSASFMCRETGALTREELIRIYERRTGFDLGNLLWYYVLALYKGAVIIQQIYYRYHHGLTKDERFARMGDVTKALARRAAVAIDTSKI
jgi:aminoglycoside phosphotransferase (APT) family kinase protein